MPELPEVETTCRGIRDATIGKKIKKIVIRHSQLRWPVPKVLENLSNLKIVQVERRAKYILLTTLQGTLIIHLGMTGRLAVVNGKVPFKKHDHVDFILNNDTLMRYTDHRRFGTILWTTDDPLKHTLLVKLGPEPFSNRFNAAYLFNIAAQRKINIKQLIMDQHVVVGVGNIYANEALFAAKISPLKEAKTLTLPECKTLVTAIRKILNAAIKQGGTTLRDFLSSQEKPGYFVQKLKVYGREGLNCLHCENPLDSARLGQRATVFCLHCQQ
jgi:formamidopyrimidine-DNA glycosylase